MCVLSEFALCESVLCESVGMYVSIYMASVYECMSIYVYVCEYMCVCVCECVCECVFVSM